MRPLTWIAAGVFIIGIGIPFIGLAILLLPAWAVLLIFARQLRALDPLFNVASVVAGAGLAVYLVMLVTVMVGSVPSTGGQLALSLAGLVLFSVFLFVTCGALQLLATQAGEARIATICHTLRWASLALGAVQVVTGAVALTTLDQDTVPGGVSVAFQVCTLAAMLVSVTFVYVAIKIGNEDWADAPR